jgi:ADP-ribosylglycohydrolase
LLALLAVASVEEFGQSCLLASSFPSSSHCLVKHSDSFADAMLANARAGGDNAGRAGMIGGWLGALLGVDAVPEEWRNKLSARDRIAAAVEKLVPRCAA